MPPAGHNKKKGKEIEHGVYVVAHIKNSIQNPIFRQYCHIIFARQWKLFFSFFLLLLNAVVRLIFNAPKTREIVL